MIEPNSIVFIVDDDLSVRRSTERLIQSAGLKVQTFTSAKEFLIESRLLRAGRRDFDIKLNPRRTLTLIHPF
jgi:FixJ family two-component response regulator